MGQPHITVQGLMLAYGERVVLRELDFTIERGKVFVLMGGSGCGKSTVLRALIGLLEPTAGEIFYDATSFTKAGPDERDRILRRLGVLYQSGALWSSMTRRIITRASRLFPKNRKWTCTPRSRSIPPRAISP
jgi:phospholipid/cholesterol/gamma-HCH transport system ATP-binding protein